MGIRRILYAKELPQVLNPSSVAACQQDYAVGAREDGTELPGASGHWTA